MTYFKSGKYRVLLGTTPVPPEAKEAYASNQGTTTISTNWPCSTNRTPLPLGLQTHGRIWNCHCGRQGVRGFPRRTESVNGH